MGGSNEDGEGAPQKELETPAAGGGGGGGGSTLDGATAEIFANMSKVTIQQSFSLAEAVTGGCCEMQNKYVVTNEGGDKVFMVTEKSKGLCRCCCAPNHPFTLQFRPAEADPESAPVMTIERPGCCSKWLCCFACPGEMCMDGAKIHAGFVDHETIGENPTDKVFGNLRQPKCGGCCTPTINVIRGADPLAENYGKIEGPMIFGGCSELCCDFDFKVSKAESEKKTGDLAIITKQKPKSLKDAAKEAVGDSDMFTMEFTDNSLSAEDKATLLSGLFLIDFMFFELDNGMCDPMDLLQGKCTCTLCLCYCAGCLCPCKITVDPNGGGGGGGE